MFILETSVGQAPPERPVDPVIEHQMILLQGDCETSPKKEVHHSWAFVPDMLRQAYC